MQFDENHKTISRDYEYKRLGTVSLLAGIDLQTGEAVPGRFTFRDGTEIKV